MSKIYYDCKVKYRKTDENGIQKIVTESYLVDAVSFTEAESIINEQMQQYIANEFKVTNIKTSNFSEVHYFENSDRFFKSKISLIAYDEESGKERKQNLYLLVEANNAKEAYENTVTAMINTMGDYIIPSVSETSVMHVFEHSKTE